MTIRPIRLRTHGSVVLAASILTFAGTGLAKVYAATVEAAPAAFSTSTLQQAVSRTTGLLSVRDKAAHLPILDRRISIALRDASTEAALRAIAKEAGLQLSYAADVLSGNRGKVSLGAQSITVGDALARVLEGQGLDVLISAEGLAAVVRRSEPEPETPEPRAGSVSGRVVEAGSGIGMVGVHVHLEGTGLRAITNQTGHFFIRNVPAGNYTVIAQRLGFAAARSPVTVSDGEQSSVTLALEASAVALDELVVTGTIVETRAREIPSPITVISAEQIEAKRAGRLDELLRGAAPGLVAFDRGSATMSNHVSVRGANTLTINYLKIYIDGVEVANPFFLAVLDPAMVERMELVRGPQASTMYGSDAANGVLQIFTKKGADLGLDRPRIEGRTSIGYINSDYATDPFPVIQENAVTITGGQGGYGYSVGGSFRRGGNWMPESADAVGSVFGGLRAAQGPLSAEVSFRHLRHTFDSPRNPILERYDVYGGKSDDLAWVQKQQTVGLTVRYRAFERWSHDLTFGVDQQDLSYHQRAPRFRTPADSLLSAYDVIDDKTNLRYNTSLSLQLSDRATIDVLGGIDRVTLKRNFLSASGLQSTTGSIPNASVSRSTIANTGVFAQGKLSLLDALFLTAGVRVEDNPNIGGNGRTTAPRFGAAYTRPLGGIDTKFRVSWGRSIKPPLQAQRLGAVTAASETLGNPGIRVEQQVGWDAGVDLHFGNRGSLAVTYYDQTAKDLIDRVVIDLTSTPQRHQYQNLGAVDNHGIEIEGTLSLGRIRLQGNVAFTTSEVESLESGYGGDLVPGDRMRVIPERTASLIATWNVLRGSASVELQHTGEWIELDYVDYYGFAYGGQPYKGSLTAYYVPYDPFTVVNVRIDQAITDHLSGFLTIDNLTDNQNAGESNFFPTRGITPIVGLRFAF